MGWLVQVYEGQAHVVPNTEPGHVLDFDACPCVPTRSDIDSRIALHHDEADRILAASNPPKD